MKKYLFISLVIIGLASCKSEKKKLEEKILELEQQQQATEMSKEKMAELADLYISYSEKFDTAQNAPFYLLKGAQLSEVIDSNARAIRLYERFMELYKEHAQENLAITHLASLYRNFAESNPTEKISEEYLFKSAQYNNKTGRYHEAVRLFLKFKDTYPQHPKSPDALFIAAFIYENNLDQKDNARKAYEEFLQKHPDHVLAKDVKFTLDNWGKSPEELFETIKKNQPVN